MTKHEIKVKFTDIQTGEPLSLDKYPLGKAVQRAFPGKKIRVGYGFVSVDETLYKLPKATENMIRQFEDGQHIPPYTTLLEEVVKCENGIDNGNAETL